jgi:hypothetical protein
LFRALPSITITPSINLMRCPMSDDNPNHGRRSTRLAISVPVVISGLDAEGNPFRESVHTLLVNKHGGKIAITRHLLLGAEVLIENLVIGTTAKAHVVWFGEKRPPRESHHVGLQLLEAQNIWGIEFPPDDWDRAAVNAGGAPAVQAEPAAPAPAAEPAPPAPAPEGVTAVAPAVEPAAKPAPPVETAAPAPAATAAEISGALRQEWQAAAAAQAQEFEERLKALAQRVGWDFESGLRERAARAEADALLSLDEEFKSLRDSVEACRAEVRALQAGVEELKRALDAAQQNVPPMPVTEAQRQLSALANSVIAKMNRAAEAGLQEYRRLLEKEKAAQQGGGGK